jgi:hypothetical protein
MFRLSSVLSLGTEVLERCAKIACDCDAPSQMANLIDTRNLPEIAPSFAGLLVPAVSSFGS